jgi:predicted RNA-binding Zn-ribbon protein involved in translation (DUF1610 family)
MKRVYACTHCKAILNPSAKIVLKARLGEQKGLFLFSPRPGNYDLFIPSNFPLKEGDEVEFSCPVCGKDLTSKRGASWAEIEFQSSADIRGTVLFSKTYGVHATCFITEENLRWYGEDANPAINFYGEGGWRDREME